MEQRVIVTGWPAVGGRKKSKVTLKFDSDSGKLKNPRDLAKSGLVGWGRWQDETKFPSQYGHVWYVTTPGHGGYILVTQEKHAEFGVPFLTVETEKYYDREYVAYAYEFEEDGNWAILELFDPMVAKKSLKIRNGYRTSSGKEPYSMNEYMQTVVSTIKRWGSTSSRKRVEEIEKRLEYLRGEIGKERISYGEIAELESLSDYIDPSDVLLLEWAGVPERE